MDDGRRRSSSRRTRWASRRSKAPARTPTASPTTAPGLEPFTGIALGSAHGQPDQHGQRLRHHRQRRAGPRSRTSSRRSSTQDGETLYDHTGERPAGHDGQRTSPPTSPTRCSRSSRSGTGTAALGLDRPAAGKTGTATNDDGDVVSAWFAGYTPQLATSVMYVRGKGNGKLDGWLPVVLRRRLPAETWTAVMTARHGGRRGRGLPGAGVRRRRGADRRPRSRRCRRADQEADADRDTEHTDRPTKTPTEVPTPTQPTPRRRRPSRRPPHRRPADGHPDADLDLRHPRLPTTPTDTPTPTPTASTAATAAAAARTPPASWAWWSRMRW